MDEYYQDNLIIKSLIERKAKESNTFFIGRIPEIEVNTAYYYSKTGQILDILRDALENNAGIRLNGKKSLDRYVREYTNAYKNCDLIANWEKTGEMYAGNKFGQDYIEGECPNIQTINARALEPYYFLKKEHWLKSLKGKKVLIISPFIESMKKQEQKGFHNIMDSSWFEDIELSYIIPPLTLAGNHQNKDWSEHYKEFLKRLNEHKEFDVALVSCGGYGMPVCNYIYSEMKKSVIYIGGALQLFFGILGKRWMTNKPVLQLVNDNWIRPSKTEKPANFTNVEKGCYW